MPAHAFDDRKKRVGSGPVSSTSASEHEDAPPSLRHAEVLGVQYAPCGASPGSMNHASVGPSSPSRRLDGGVAADQSAQEGAESVVGDAENSGDVLPDDPGRGASSSASKIVDCISEPHELQGQVAARVRERAAQARHAERLARGAADEQVGIDDPRLVAQHGEVAVQRDVREVVRQDGAREGLDLAERKRAPPELVPRCARGLDAAADGQVLHRNPASTITTPPVIAPMHAQASQ